MSVRGEIVIECDTPGCHAEHAVAADDAFRVAGREYAEDEGWIEAGGQNICPECVAESQPENQQPTETRP